MIELRCKSCGGNLEIDEDKEFGTCPFCKTKYKINEEHKVIFTMDDNTKETINQRDKTVSKMSLAVFIPFVIVIISVIVIIIFTIVNINKGRAKISTEQKNIMRMQEQIMQNSINGWDNNWDSLKDNIQNGIGIQEKISQENKNDFEKKSFNNRFEIYSGTGMGGNVKDFLDSVVTNNKKEDRKITISYDDFESDNPEDISDLKNKIETFNNYEVKFDYDENGFIENATIEDE